MTARLFWVQVFCFILAGTAVWANYRIVEEARVASIALHSVSASIAGENSSYKDEQVAYAALSQPTRIQQLAEDMLNMQAGAIVQMASLTVLPRRGAQEEHIQSISAQMTERGSADVASSGGAAGEGGGD